MSKNPNWSEFELSALKIVWTRAELNSSSVSTRTRVFGFFLSFINFSLKTALFIYAYSNHPVPRYKQFAGSPSQWFQVQFQVQTSATGILSCWRISRKKLPKMDAGHITAIANGRLLYVFLYDVYWHTFRTVYVVHEGDTFPENQNVEKLRPTKLAPALVSNVNFSTISAFSWGCSTAKIGCVHRVCVCVCVCVRACVRARSRMWCDQFV